MGSETNALCPRSVQLGGIRGHQGAGPVSGRVRAHRRHAQSFCPHCTMTGWRLPSRFAHANDIAVRMTGAPCIKGARPCKVVQH
jgi:hypothetical protein